MTEKQVVPKYVADWIEYCKSNNFLLLWALDPVTALGDDLVSDYKGNLLKTMSWIKSGQDEFARAWLNGYEVEQPIRYMVTIKGVKCNYKFLKYHNSYKYWYFGDNASGSSLSFSHTKDGLEKQDLVGYSLVMV